MRRWEKGKGLPVHRHLHRKLGTVYAFTSELDNWLAVATLRALDAGTVDVCLAFNLLAFQAVKSDRLLGHRSEMIKALTVAYMTPAQVVVRSDSGLESLADLKGKRVSLGIVESGDRFCSEILLGHLGIDTDDLSDHFLDFGASLAALLEGRLDAYITWRGLPVTVSATHFPRGSSA